MVENRRERKKGKKDNGKGGSLCNGYENVLKQPEKNAQRDPGEKGQTLLLWKGGTPQAELLSDI